MYFSVLAAFALAAQAQNANDRAHQSAERFSSRLAALVAQHQYERADQLVEQRLADGGDRADTYFLAGKVYFAHEDWQRSADRLEKSLSLRGINDQAHQLLGLDWRQLHRPDDAEAELLEAAKENPLDRQNAYLAGHQLLIDGKFEAALPYLYKALDSKPLESQALAALGLAQARLGNYGLAESYYRKAIESTATSDDSHYSALINLAVLLLLGHDSARLEEGLTCARRAASLQPGSPEPHYLSGKALLKLGRLREASPELERAAKLNPQDAKPHFLLARIYDDLGQHEHARKERDKITIIEHRPGQTGMATRDPVPVPAK